MYIVMFISFISNTYQTNYAFGIVCGSLLLFDLFFNQPLKHPTLNMIYTMCACLYTVGVSVTTIWNFSDVMIGYEVLNSVLLISMLLYFGIRIWQEVLQTMVLNR